MTSTRTVTIDGDTYRIVGSDLMDGGRHTLHQGDTPPPLTDSVELVEVFNAAGELIERVDALPAEWRTWSPETLERELLQRLRP